MASQDDDSVDDDNDDDDEDNNDNDDDDNPKVEFYSVLKLQSCLSFVTQGTAWKHIVTDVPFVSISVGCKCRVWGIAENGTAYVRAGFGENNTTGV